MSLADRVDDAVAANDLRAGRTPHPAGPTVKWHRGKALEVDGLPVAEGQSAERALLKFLDDVMGDDVGLADALDLRRLSFSLLYSDDARRLAWVKCPVDPAKLRSPRDREQAAQFVDEVSRRRPRVRPPDIDGSSTDLWAVGDLQLGKGSDEAFGGLARTLSRFDWLLRERLPAVTGRPDRIHIALLGDITEGVCGSYENQEWTTVLNTAEQFRAALGIAHRLVERAMDLAPQVDVSAIGSNHGQNSRGKGKRNVTDHWDDRAFMLLDALALAVKSNPDRYHDRVRIIVPENPLVAGFQLRDTVFATTHGHQVTRGGQAVIKMDGWWEDQIASRLGAAAAAQVLIAAHHHHYYLLRNGGRLLVGIPSLDGGSGYLHEGSGVWSLPGFVTLKVDDYGVQDPLVHTWPEDRARAAELGVAVP